MRNPHWVDPGPTPRCPAKTTGDETVTGTCDSGYGHGRSPNQSPSEGEGSRGQRSKHHPRLASTLAMLSITAQSSRQTTLIPSLCPLPRGGVGDRTERISIFDYADPLPPSSDVSLRSENATDRGNVTAKSINYRGGDQHKQHYTPGHRAYR